MFILSLRNIPAEWIPMWMAPDARDTNPPCDYFQLWTGCDIHGIGSVIFVDVPCREQKKEK